MCQDVNGHLVEVAKKPPPPNAIKQEVIDLSYDDEDNHDIEDPDEDEPGELGETSMTLPECKVDLREVSLNTSVVRPPAVCTGWKCPLCKTLVPEFDQMRDHLKEHYSEDEPQCPLCPETFTRSSKVYAHIISVHKKEFDGPIEAADMATDPTYPTMTFQPPADYNHNHSNYDEDESAEDVKDLNTSRKARENYQFKCPLCPKTYAYACNLYDHWIVHTDERPFICVHCRLAFRNKKAAFKHMAEAHPEVPKGTGITLAAGSVFHSRSPWEVMGYTDITNHGEQVKEIIVPAPVQESPKKKKVVNMLPSRIPSDEFGYRYYYVSSILLIHNHAQEKDKID